MSQSLRKEEFGQPSNWMNFVSLTEIVEQHAQEDPDHCALVFLNDVDPPVTITRGQLAHDARQTALDYTSKGIHPGDVVLLAMDHSYMLIRAFLGALYLGALPGILNYKVATTPDWQAQLLAQVHKLQAKAVITLPSAEAAMHKQLAGTNCVTLTLDTMLTGSISPADQNEVPTRAGHAFQQGDSPAYLQFTTGTTGLAKAVILTHSAVIHNNWAISEHLRLSEKLTTVAWLPYYHDMGLNASLWISLLRGGTAVTISPSAFIRRPAILFEALHHYRAEVTVMPNFGYRYSRLRVTTEELAGLDFSSLRVAANGAEQISFEIAQSFITWLIPYGLRPQVMCPAYGMAENVVAITLKPPDEPMRVDWISAHALQQNQAIPTLPHNAAAETAHDAARPIVSCGVPLSGVGVRIIDEQGQARPERWVGEVAIKGNSLFSGYYGAQHATPNALTAGWFYTGDLGYLAEGELFICGRKKDLIIVAGHNIHPEQVEAIAREALGARVRQVVAFGIADETTGTESPILICEMAKVMDEAQDAQIALAVRQRITQELGVALQDIYFVPKGWIIHEDQKLARAANRAQYLAEKPPPAQPVTVTEASDPEQVIVQALCQLFAKILGIPQVGIDDDFFALGGDSLSALRLAMHVQENWGKQIPHEFFLVPTVRRLAHLLQHHPTTELEELFPPVQTMATATHTYPNLLQHAWKNKRKIPSFLGTKAHNLPAVAHKLLEAHILQLPVPQLFERLWWWCDQPIVQTLLYPQETRLIEAFSRAMNSDPNGLSEAKTMALFLRVLCRTTSVTVTDPADKNKQSPPRKQVRSAYWRARNKTPEEQTMPLHEASFVHISGQVHVEQAQQGGTGVILAVYHSPANIIANRVLMQLFDNSPLLMNIGLLQRIYTKFYPDVPLPNNLEELAWVQSIRLQMASQFLQEGGLVAAAWDGQRGHSPAYPLAVGNHDYPFKTGLAELALQTGAAIVPLLMQLDRLGNIYIKFQPPLTPTRTTDDQQQRVQLLHQFAAFMGQQWQQTPSHVELQTIQRYLAAPSVKQAMTRVKQ